MTLAALKCIEEKPEKHLIYTVITFGTVLLEQEEEFNVSQYKCQFPCVVI